LRTRLTAVGLRADPVADLFCATATTCFASAAIIATPDSTSGPGSGVAPGAVRGISFFGGLFPDAALAAGAFLIFGSFFSPFKQHG
jgi:hypothetical protein